MLRIDTLTIKKSRKPHPCNTQARGQSYKSAFQAMTENLRLERFQREVQARVDGR